jgi:hypothetical protein
LDESGVGLVSLMGDKEGWEVPFISDKTLGTRLNARVDWDAVEGGLEDVVSALQLGDPLMGCCDFLVGLFGAIKERPCGCLSHSAKVFGQSSSSKGLKGGEGATR